MCFVATAATWPGSVSGVSRIRFAYEYGYQQIFVEDAMSAQSIAEHTHVIQVVFPRIGRVSDTEAVLADLG